MLIHISPFTHISPSPPCRMTAALPPPGGGSLETCAAVNVFQIYTTFLRYRLLNTENNVNTAPRHFDFPTPFFVKKQPFFNYN